MVVPSMPWGVSIYRAVNCATTRQPTGQVGRSTENDATLLNGVLLRDNRSQQGGAVAANGSLTVNSSRFLSNQADYGGALSINGGDSTLVNTLLARNSSTTGATVQISTTGTVQILHATIASPTWVNNAAIEVLTGTLAVTDPVYTNYALAILTEQASDLRSPSLKTPTSSLAIP